MWVSGLPPELSDQLVNDLTGLRARVDVSIHLAPMDRGESMTLVRRKNAEIKMQVMDQRRKNRKQGLDPTTCPTTSPTSRSSSASCATSCAPPTRGSWTRSS